MLAQIVKQQQIIRHRVGACAAIERELKNVASSLFHQLYRLSRGGSPGGAHRPDAIAIANERSGARHDRVALGETFAHFDVSRRDQSNGHPPAFDLIVAHHLNDGAFPLVGHGRERHRRAAAAGNFDDGAAKSAGAQLLAAADGKTNATELCGRD